MYLVKRKSPSEFITYKEGTIKEFTDFQMVTQIVCKDCDKEYIQ